MIQVLPRLVLVTQAGEGQLNQALFIGENLKGCSSSWLRLLSLERGMSGVRLALKWAIRF